jgi:phage tail-like protein
MPKRRSPLVGYHFVLEVEGQVIGSFTECSGLGSEHEVTEARDGSDPDQSVIKLPGRPKWENITLKRGFSKDKSLWDWRKKVIDPDPGGFRQNGSIVLYDRKNKEVARWNFQRAWPVKIAYVPPSADSNEIGVEELTIVHEYIERVS